MNEERDAPRRSTAERIPARTAIEVPRHPDVARWRPATIDDVDDILALMTAAELVDHPAWTTPRDEIEETFTSSWIDPDRDILLGFDTAGRAVAMGSTWIHPTRDTTLKAYLDGVVHPELRGRGIGRDLLRWEHERAGQALAELDSTLPAEIDVYADETNTALQRLAVRRGFAVERWFSTMIRDLSDEIPEVTAAGEPEIVPYSAPFSEATRSARNDAFRDHWGSLETPEERWNQFIGGPHLRPDLSRIAVEGDAVVAFALGSVNEDDWELQGYSSVYIDLIGVVRDHRGRRLAPAVITAQLRAARDAGLQKAVLDVDTESPTGANSLYGGLGFLPAERSVALALHC